MPLIDQVIRTLQRRLRVARGAPVVAAVSGGADSVALAWLLAELGARGVVALRGLAYFNHQLRGADDAADEAFVVALAARIGVPVRVGRGDVAGLAQARHESIEAAGRRARYAFLKDAAADLGATFVATGHSLEDQAETVLLRLLRGAGPRGLAGIRARRGAIIRPIIECRRAELRAYLVARGEQHREDPSNADVRFARNRVRHELLPVIEHLAPGGLEALARTAALAGDDEDVLTRAARSAAARVVEDRGTAVELLVAPLAALSPAIARRVIRAAIEQAAPASAPRLSSRHIEAVWQLARGGDARRVDLSGASARTVDDRIVISSGRATSPVPVGEVAVVLRTPGEVVVPECGWRISARYCTPSRDQMAARGVEAREAREIAVPAGSLDGPVTVRNRRPGDRIKPIGARGRKKLQDLLVDRKVPREERDRVPVIVDRHGRIVWVVGVAMADEFRVTAPEAEVVVFTAERQ